MDDTAPVDVFDGFEYRAHQACCVSGESLEVVDRGQELTARNSCPWHISDQRALHLYTGQSIGRDCVQSGGFDQKSGIGDGRRCG